MSFVPPGLGKTMIYLDTQMHAGQPVPVGRVLDRIGPPDYRDKPTLLEVTLQELKPRMHQALAGKNKKGIAVWLWHPAIRAHRIEWATLPGKVRGYAIEVVPSIAVVVLDGQVILADNVEYLPRACMALGLSYEKLKTFIEQGKETAEGVQGAEKR
jgi:hypothetical protein